MQELPEAVLQAEAMVQAARRVREEVALTVETARRLTAQLRADVERMRQPRDLAGLYGPPLPAAGDPQS